MNGLTNLSARLRSRPQGTPTERPKPNTQPSDKPGKNDDDKLFTEAWVW